MCPTACVSFSVRLDVLKLSICLCDVNGHVESCVEGGRHGGVSVVMGGRLSVGGDIQRIEVGD